MCVAGSDQRPCSGQTPCSGQISQERPGARHLWAWWPVMRVADSDQRPCSGQAPCIARSARSGLGIVTLGVQPCRPMTDQGPKTLGRTQYPDTNIGTIRTDLLGKEGACIHLGPGNPQRPM